MKRFDDMKSGIESLSNSTNTVVFDDYDAPSIVVVIPEMTLGDLGIIENSNEIHPAFKDISGAPIYKKVGFSKYPNIIIDNRAYSLPLKDPARNITWNKANEVCKNKGLKWCLCPDILWAAVSLYSKNNNTLPRGNNSNGCDYYNNTEKGERASFEELENKIIKTNTTYTGSGPTSWSHDWTAFGIMDMNGNVNKWTNGLRFVYNEIQFIPYAGCATESYLNLIDKNYSGWKAIKIDGSFEIPNGTGKTNYTLKFDLLNDDSNKWSIVNTSNISTQLDLISKDFKLTNVSEGVLVPDYLKCAGLIPLNENDSDYNDMQFIANAKLLEGMSIRGGSWNSSKYSGQFYTDLSKDRNFSSDDIGFFSVYYGEEL